MTDAQLQLLRRIADQGRQAGMDVALGANVLAALLDELEAAQAERDGAIRALGDIVFNPRVAAIVDRYAPEALTTARKITEVTP